MAILLSSPRLKGVANHQRDHQMDRLANHLVAEPDQGGNTGSDCYTGDTMTKTYYEDVNLVLCYRLG